MSTVDTRGTFDGLGRCTTSTLSMSSWSLLRYKLSPIKRIVVLRLTAPLKFQDVNSCPRAPQRNQPSTSKVIVFLVKNSSVRFKKTKWSHFDKGGDISPSIPVQCPFINWISSLYAVDEISVTTKTENNYVTTWHFKLCVSGDGGGCKKIWMGQNFCSSRASSR